MPYIPKTHEKYNILPTCRKYNVEIFVWDNALLKKIQKLTNMTDHMVCPYQRYKSYEEFLEEIDNWINKFPNFKQEIIEYKDSIIKMNNKDLWGIIQYIGETNYSFTNGNYYYVPMYVENNSWIMGGIIDNEEYTDFDVWSSNCTNPINLIKDFKIIIDPSNSLNELFNRRMNSAIDEKHNLNI